MYTHSYMQELRSKHTALSGLVVLETMEICLPRILSAVVNVILHHALSSMLLKYYTAIKMKQLDVHKYETISQIDHYYV